MTTTLSPEAIAQAEQLFKGNEPSPSRTPGQFDMKGYLEKYGIPFKIKTNGKGTLYVLEHCLFDPSHAGGESSIIQGSNGALYYQCFHLTCKDRTWKEAREKISGDDSLKQFSPSLSPQGQGKSKPMVLTKLGDLLNEPEEETPWLLEGILPSGGFSTVVGKPKAGKSTWARNLSLKVGRGESFMGRDTEPGGVVYLALEEKRSEVKNHFKKMGALGDEEVYIYASTAPADALLQIRKVVEEKRPVLLIIDPLFRLARVKDGNDYIQVTNALEPLLSLARETGTHVLVVHHAGKGDRTGGDSILGSTAIHGSVDTAIFIRRHERGEESYRSISSSQRYGDDLTETVLIFDAETKSTTLGEPKSDMDLKKVKKGILEFLASQNDPQIEAVIDDQVEGKKSFLVKGLRELVSENVVLKHGRGGKGDPFKYCLKDPQNDSGSLVPTIYKEQENKKNKNGLTGYNNLTYSCSDQIPKKLKRLGTRKDPKNDTAPLVDRKV
jgi:hypothetical protein